MSVVSGADLSNPESTNLNVKDLPIVEIKEKLRELGVKTRVRKLEKLREILQLAVQTTHEQIVT